LGAGGELRRPIFGFRVHRTNAMGLNGYPYELVGLWSDKLLKHRICQAGSVIPTQQIPITPSVRLAVGLCATHFAAAAALWWVPMPVWAKAMFVIALAASLVYYLARNAALHAPNAIVALEIKDDGAVALQTRRGEWLDCELLPSSFVSRNLTIVNLRPHGRRRARYVILVPDNVDARDFRRLRMWLRWAARSEVQRT